MGMNQQFRTTANWDQAVSFLDHSFPLAQGSYGTAQAYLVYFDHLLVIQEDGSATGLIHPSQFVEAGGNEEAPQSILLQDNGLQVEIELAQKSDREYQNSVCSHRMQLLTRIENLGV